MDMNMNNTCRRLADKNVCNLHDTSQTAIRRRKSQHDDKIQQNKNSFNLNKHDIIKCTCKYCRVCSCCYDSSSTDCTSSNTNLDTTSSTCCHGNQATATKRNLPNDLPSSTELICIKDKTTQCDNPEFMMNIPRQSSKLFNDKRTDNSSQVSSEQSSHQTTIPVIPKRSESITHKLANIFECCFKTLLSVICYPMKRIKSKYHENTNQKGSLLVLLHLILIFIGLVLKVLVNFKTLTACFVKPKPILSVVLAITVLFICKYLNSYVNTLFCVLSNVIYETLFSTNDAYYDIIKSSGIPCDPLLQLYYVQTTDKSMLQIEASPNDLCTPIKYCSKINYQVPDESNIKIITNTNHNYLDYQCSKLFYNSRTVIENSATSFKNFESALSELVSIEYIEAEIIAETVNEKMYCSSKSDSDISKCNKLNDNTNYCIQKHRLCRPKIESKTRKFNIDNQLRFDISHCYCDREFYNCLKRMSTPSTDYIAQIYFNYLKPKCFHFEYRYKCELYVLGVCLIHGKPACYAKLQENPTY